MSKVETFYIQRVGNGMKMMDLSWNHTLKRNQRLIIPSTFTIMEIKKSKHKIEARLDRVLILEGGGFHMRQP